MLKPTRQVPKPIKTYPSPMSETKDEKVMGLMLGKASRMLLGIPTPHEVPRVTLHFNPSAAHVHVEADDGQGLRCLSSMRKTHTPDSQL